MRETVRAVIINRDLQTYLVQHKEKDPKDQGKWSTPGGGIEAGDSDHPACLLRELKEEFGEEFAPLFRVGAKLFQSFRKDRVDHFYFVFYRGEELEPKVPDEVIKGHWFAKEELEKISLFFGFEPQLVGQAIGLYREALKVAAGLSAREK
ncbi:MAG: NUDIX hydrolase [Bdellovibrionia bacterium]